MPPLLTSLRMPCRNARLKPPMNGPPRGERQAVGDDRVEHGDQAGDGEARHHRVADVLLADHAAVEQAEARDRHHQDERDGGQHPGGVAGVGRALGQDGRARRDGGDWPARRRRDGGGAGGRRRRRGLAAARSGAAQRRARRAAGAARGDRRRAMALSPESRSARQSPAPARGQRRNLRQFHFRKLQWRMGCGSPQRASASFSPVRMRTAESRP